MVETLTWTNVQTIEDIYRGRVTPEAIASRRGLDVGSAKARLTSLQGRLSNVDLRQIRPNRWDESLYPEKGYPSTAKGESLFYSKNCAHCRHAVFSDPYTALRGCPTFRAVLGGTDGDAWRRVGRYVICRELKPRLQGVAGSSLVEGSEARGFSRGPTGEPDDDFRRLTCLSVLVIHSIMLLH